MSVIFALRECASHTWSLLAAEGDLRLAPEASGASEDGTAEFGRLEIFARGGWGTICDREADSKFTVERLPASSFSSACRQLGFDTGERTIAVRSYTNFACILRFDAVECPWQCVSTALRTSFTVCL